MPRDERGREEEAFLESLCDALGDEGVEDVSALRHSLEEREVDVEGVLSEGRRLFSDFLRRQRLARARVRFEEIRQAVIGVVRSEAWSMSSARDEIARALSGESSGEVYAAYHRKLESVEGEDLESLKDDAALLEFIESMDRER